jgi:diacylglycerol kinase (ATP)
MIPPEKPARASGFAHLLAATRYSAAGLKRLWRESAFRQEVVGGALGLGVLLVTGASLPEVLGFVILWLILAAVETLNTALEVLVDQVSPGWSEFARDAKDLGSLAVALLIGANAAYVLWVLVG